ncbi:MAG: hypothetical protein ABJY83_00725 [Roseibium sp.]
MLDGLIESVVHRGDLAHLALFLWAMTATGLGFVLVRELSLSNRRFADFVNEIARLNRHLAEFISD